VNSYASCPCSSGLRYVDCRLPVLDDHRLALTAEMLMRSRYTAFVVGRIDHLIISWHPANRPTNLDLLSGRVKWLGLEIHQVTLVEKATLPAL